MSIFSHMLTRISALNSKAPFHVYKDVHLPSPYQQNYSELLILLLRDGFCFSSHTYFCNYIESKSDPY